MMARYPKHYPTFKGYDLLGASNLVRFALKYAEGCPPVCRAKRVGLSVCGMSAGKCSRFPTNVVGVEFLHRTKREGEKCLVLLGTNDVLLAGKSSSIRDSFNDLRKNLNHVRRIVRRRYKRVVFLTIPPIPIRGERINAQVKRINRFMMGWKQDSDFQVLPLHEVLCLENGSPDTFLFEKFFTGKRRRPDGIHLNEYGLAVMQEFLQAVL